MRKALPMPRHLHDNHSAPAMEHMQSFHAPIVSEVEQAIATHPVVIVGMRQNPVVKRARKVLNEASIEFTYLEYGSYFSMWKERLAIKLWSGWPTYPQVFVHGTLIGGCAKVKQALSDGSFQAALDAGR